MLWGSTAQQRPLLGVLRLRPRFTPAQDHLAKAEGLWIACGRSPTRRFSGLPFAGKAGDSLRDQTSGRTATPGAASRAVIKKAITHRQGREAVVLIRGKSGSWIVLARHSHHGPPASASGRVHSTRPSQTVRRQGCPPPRSRSGLASPASDARGSTSTWGRQGSAQQLQAEAVEPRSKHSRRIRPRQRRAPGGGEAFRRPRDRRCRRC